MGKRLAIIGAGPIGIEAAVAATERGYQTVVFEQGELGDSVRRWGHVEMFSPFAMNASPLGVTRLRRRGRKLPNRNALLNGQAFAERYLAPLADSLEAPVHLGAEVRAVGRDAVGKMGKIGSLSRSETPLRLLIRQHGSDRFETADLVFDCSGTFRTPNSLGTGGIPAIGEEALRSEIFYGMPEPQQFVASHVLVVGGGHSAASIVRGLANTATRIIWAVRKCRTLPCTRIAQDPLPERDRLAADANRIAAEIDFRSGASVLAVQKDSSGFTVTLHKDAHLQTIHVDHVISATGFRPDLTIGRELQLQTCWATEGTYKLAAALLGESAGDCLAIPSFGAETLMHPEPGYFTLGMKSYGRTPDFLIRTGLQQIHCVFEWLERQK